MHPRDYVVALIEVTSDGDCHRRVEGNDCTIEVKVVDFLGGRRINKKRMQTSASPIKEASGSYIGDRVLVVAVPSVTPTGVYGWLLAESSPSEEEVAVMRAAVRAVRF